MIVLGWGSVLKFSSAPFKHFKQYLKLNRTFRLCKIAFILLRAVGIPLSGQVQLDWKLGTEGQGASCHTPRQVFWVR